MKNLFTNITVQRFHPISSFAILYGGRALTGQTGCPMIGSKSIYYINWRKETMAPRRISRTITFSLPPDMFEQVQRVKEEGRDISELMRESLRLYMEERELRRHERLEWLRSRQTNQPEDDGGVNGTDHSVVGQAFGTLDRPLNR